MAQNLFSNTGHVHSITIKKEKEVKYLEGTVKRWLDRGFGFIEVEGQEDQVFVHHTALEGVTELVEGQKVEFEVEDSPKGPRATNVKVL